MALFWFINDCVPIRSFSPELEGIETWKSDKLRQGIENF